MPLPTLRSASEFIDHYYSQLVTQFSSNNFKLVKTGFIGYILNVLGNTQYDIKQYYDGLFNEAFPITSVDETNLEFHSALHGYIRTLATSATIMDGHITLDLTMLPTTRPGLTARVVTFGSSSAVTGSTLPIGIDVSGNLYTVNALYNVRARLSGSTIIAYDAEIISPADQKNIGISLPSPVLPIVAGYQYYSKNTSQTVPYYVPTTFHSIDIQLSSTDMISRISVSVLDSNTGLSSVFNVDTNKTRYGPTDNVVFYTILPNNVLRVQLGSGVIGSYIPSGSTINIGLQLTSGVNGNVSISDHANTNIINTQSNNNTSTSTNIVSSQLFANSVYVIDTYGTQTTTSVIDITRFLTPTVNISSGGTDILTGETLRASLETYIQSHTHLISELDYNNYLKNMYSQYYVAFKKTLLSSNTIYAYLPLYDRYNIPYKCSTLTESLSTFDKVSYTQPLTGISVIHHPTVVSNGVTMISPFYYKYDTLFRSYDGYFLENSSIFYYSSIKSTDVSGLAVITNLPYIHATFKYVHNTISPFTIISISSYEDLSSYLTLPSSITISLTTPSITLQTNTPTHISPMVNKTGVSGSVATNTSITDTVISVVDVGIFGISGTVLINSEQISYTGRDLINNTLTGITRGINITTPSISVPGDIVYELAMSTTSIDFILGVISTSLSSSIDNIVTTIPLSDTTHFPASGVVYIDSEEISYTSKTLTSLLGCTRAFNTTTAASHNSSTGVYEKITTTSAVALPDIYFGILQNPTQMTVTLTDAITPQTNLFTFSVEQLKSINGNMFIKEYIQPGGTTSLTSSVTIVDTSITVISTVGLPISGYIQIGAEYMFYSAITATTLDGLIRGIYGSSTLAHTSGEVVTSMSITEVDIPFMEESAYLSDTSYIDNQINTNLVQLPVSSDRALSDEVQLRFLESSSISLTNIRQIVYNGSSYTGNVILPLKMDVSLLLNKAILISSGAILNDDVYTLNQDITTLLLATYTGVKIRISDADIVVVCKRISYVDDANVHFTDSVGMSIPNNEINVKPDLDIITGLTKLDRLSYVPPLWHWDINNISISYTVQ